MSDEPIVKTFGSVDEAVAVFGQIIDLDSSEIQAGQIRKLADRRLVGLETVNFTYKGKGIGILGDLDDFYPADTVDDEQVAGLLAKQGMEYFSKFGLAHLDASNGLYVFSEGKRPLKLDTLVTLEVNETDQHRIDERLLHPEMRESPEALVLISQALPSLDLLHYVQRKRQSVEDHYRAIKSLLDAGMRA